MQQLPDLVICDVSMPGLDGFEVFELLSARPATAVIPFIFLSARAERADVRRGMALGADDYLTKPFTRVELLDSIRVRLKRRRGSDSLPAPALPAETQPGAANEAGPVIADPAMQALFAQVDMVAHRPISVLILGETGVGKEVLAERSTARSPRATGRFVRAQLRGALRDAARERAVRPREGRVHRRGRRPSRACSRRPTAARCSSTRWASCRSPTQVKLLRVLEERKVLRVGGLSPARDRRALRRRDQPRPRGARSAAAASARTSTSGSTASR